MPSPVWLWMIPGHSKLALILSLGCIAPAVMSLWYFRKPYAHFFPLMAIPWLALAAEVNAEISLQMGKLAPMYVGYNLFMLLEALLFIEFARRAGAFYNQRAAVPVMALCVILWLVQLFTTPIYAKFYFVISIVFSALMLGLATQLMTRQLFNFQMPFSRNPYFIIGASRMVYGAFVLLFFTLTILEPDSVYRQTVATVQKIVNPLAYLALCYAYLWIPQTSKYSTS